MSHRVTLTNNYIEVISEIIFSLLIATSSTTAFKLNLAKQKGPANAGPFFVTVLGLSPAGCGRLRGRLLHISVSPAGRSSMGLDDSHRRYAHGVLWLSERIFLRGLPLGYRYL